MVLNDGYHDLVEHAHLLHQCVKHKKMFFILCVYRTKKGKTAKKGDWSCLEIKCKIMVKGGILSCGHAVVFDPNTAYCHCWSFSP